MVKSCRFVSLYLNKSKKQNNLPFFIPVRLRLSMCSTWGKDHRASSRYCACFPSQDIPYIFSARGWQQWTQAPATPWQTWSLALWRNLQHNQRARWHFRWIDNPKSLLQWCHSCSRRWLLTTHCWPDLAPLINGWRDLNIHSLKTSSTSWNTHIIHNIC